MGYKSLQWLKNIIGEQSEQPSCTVRMIFLSIYIYIFPGQCHTVISNLAITRIILNPFYNAAVYTAYSEPTMHCILLVYLSFPSNSVYKPIAGYVRGVANCEVVQQGKGVIGEHITCCNTLVQVQSPMLLPPSPK